MRKSIVTCLAAMSAAGMIATPATAAEDTVSVVVPYTDLDLSDPAGAATLERRIATAVNVVCEKPAMRDLKAMVAWEECKASARDGALEQLSAVDRYENLALASAF